MEKQKVVIEKAVLTIHTKVIISDAALAHTAILKQGKSAFVLNQRVKLKHLSISWNTTSFKFRKHVYGTITGHGCCGLVDNADFYGHLYKKPLNFQNFSVIRIELICNGMSVPRQSYPPNFSDKRYNKDNLLYK